MLLPLFLALAAPVAGDCDFPENYEIDEPRPFQKAGAGLWIGGIGFAATDIATVRASEDRYGLGWSLELGFTPAGNTKFLEAQRCGVGKPLEISIDRHVLSRPMLNERILGGKAMIAGSWKTREEVDSVIRQITGR